MRPEIIIADATGLMAISLVLFVLTIAWILALFDLVRNHLFTPHDKSLWILLLVLVPPLGLVLYWILGASQKDRIIRKHGADPEKHFSS